MDLLTDRQYLFLNMAALLETMIRHGVVTNDQYEQIRLDTYDFMWPNGPDDPEEDDADEDCHWN